MLLAIKASRRTHLEVTRRHPHVVLPPWVVELRQPPVDQPELLLLVVDHDVVRLHVSVHDPVRVRVVQRLEQLEDVIPAVFRVGAEALLGEM